MIRSTLTAITRLARAGALEQAWGLFQGSGYDPLPDDADVLTVYGRLLKDRAAQASGPAREELLNQAIAAYTRASGLSRATYPLINAATLAYLSGRRDQAATLARQTIALLDSGQHAAETQYWLGATRAEALLLLGQVPEARSALGSAIERQPDAWEDHASTLRQFGLILRETGADESWLNRYRPPPCLHFDGIIGIAPDDRDAAQLIEAKVAEIAPSYGIGALAAGTDIIVAEAVLQGGGHLHVVLPCLPEAFRAASVTPFGAEWEQRFDALMDEAASVVVLDDIEPLSSGGVEVGREAAMGLALRESARLQSRAAALTVRAEEKSDRDMPPADHHWAGLNLPMHKIRTRRSSATEATLPDGDAYPTALLSVPTRIEEDAAQITRARTVRKREGQSVFKLTDLAQAALAARTLAMRHGDSRIGLDYRATHANGAGGGEEIERLLSLAAAGAPGGVSLAESAALALALRLPDANVQPMGDARTPMGDLALYRLFA